MKVLRAKVEQYFQRNSIWKQPRWEIRYFTDQGERMSEETFPTQQAAQRHADAVLSGQRQLRIFGI